MSVPLCYARLTPQGLRVIIQDADDKLSISHLLSFTETKNIVEAGIQDMQRQYVKDRCKCD